jgi:hypothetical protein
VCISRTGVHLGKFPMVRRTLFCRRCIFKRWVSAAYSQAGQAYVITLLISALWTVSLILALKRSLFNTEYILINVLNFLVSVISKCSVYVILISKITPRYNFLHD